MLDPGITACIVARNAEAEIAGCLASLGGAADAVIAVDHGSTDATADIARRLGARVIASSAPSHELARDAYLEAAETPWVLVVDADERVVDPLRVRALVDGAPEDVWGFALERFDWIGAGRWASTRLVRLFRRDARIRYFASRAHAAVAPAIHDAGARVALGDAPVHHLDALLERDHAQKRAGMRARLEAQIAAGAPAILRCFHALERFAIDDDDGADEELTRALAEDARCEPIVSLFRAQQHLVRGRLDRAERDAQRALVLDQPRFRGRAGAYVVLAEVDVRRGYRAEAVATCERAIAEEPLASHHLNLAALGVDEARHLAEAKRRNPWLFDPRTYGPGATPSIFRQQDALLACAEGLLARHRTS